jgi:hypothetical protein
MANADTRKAFKAFIAARKQYRQQVDQRKFAKYTSIVTPAIHNTTKLVSQLSKTNDPLLRAIDQQAIDFMQASKRATDLRAKTFRNYVNDSRLNRLFYDLYDDSRESRYTRGLI